MNKRLNAIAISTVVLFFSTLLMADSHIETMSLMGEDADLSTYQSYSWLGVVPNPTTDEAPDLNRELYISTLRDAVDQQLAELGFKKVDEGAADFYVLALGTVNDRLPDWSSDYQLQEQRIKVNRLNVTDKRLVGNIELYLIDAESSATFWEGYANTAFRSQEVNVESITQAVDILFGEFQQKAK